MVVINTKIIEHISREKIKFKNRNFKLNKYEKCVLYAKKYLYLFNGKIELDELVNEIYIFVFMVKINIHIIHYYVYLKNYI